MTPISNALYAEIDRLRADNAVLTEDIDAWRRQWLSLSEEVAKLTAQRDKAGNAALELEQRCAELGMELSRVKQKEAE